MATRPQRELTYEDYLRFPDDGRRWELIDGEAYMVPSPTPSHQDIVGRLYRSVADHLDKHGGGRVFVAPLDVVLSDADVVQPDLVFVSDADAGVITDRNIRGTPTWVIEVVSDPVRDRKVKRDLYARYGVPEYWAVDPAVWGVEIHRGGGGRRRRAARAPGTGHAPRAAYRSRGDLRPRGTLAEDSVPRRLPRVPWAGHGRQVTRLVPPGGARSRAS